MIENPSRRAIFDGVDLSILKIAKDQGPPHSTEKPKQYAKRLCQALDDYSTNKRKPVESAVKIRFEEILRNIDKPAFMTKKIQEARIDWRYYTAFKDLIVQRLRDSEPLPPEISEFNVDLLSGNIKEPPFKRGGGYGFERRDFIISVIIFFVCHYFNLHPYKNEATGSGSAGDIVGEVSKTSRAIAEKAWTKYGWFINLPPFKNNLT